jgi:hypothetical protein
MAYTHRRINAQNENIPVNKSKKTVHSDFSCLPTNSSKGLIERVRADPGRYSPTDIFQLQRTVGNREVGAMLGTTTQRPVIQAKFTVNAPGDKYEQEADRVAEQVMRMPAAQDVAMEKKTKTSIMAKPLSPVTSIGGLEVSGGFEQQLNASRGQGHPLPSTLREEFENKFGADFSGVKIHTDSQSDALNRSIQAKAFTAGQDVFFQHGAYEPGSRVGQALIAHELTHVMQQQPTHSNNIASATTKNIVIQRKNANFTDNQYKILKEKCLKFKALRSSLINNAKELIEYANAYPATETESWQQLIIDSENAIENTTEIEEVTSIYKKIAEETARIKNIFGEDKIKPLWDAEIKEQQKTEEENLRQEKKNKELAEAKANKDAEDKAKEDAKNARQQELQNLGIKPEQNGPAFNFLPNKNKRKEDLLRYIELVYPNFRSLTVEHLMKPTCFLYYLTKSDLDKVHNKYLIDRKVVEWKVQGIPQSRAGNLRGTDTMLMPNKIMSQSGPEIGAEIFCDWVLETPRHAAKANDICEAYVFIQDLKKFEGYGGSMTQQPNSHKKYTYAGEKLRYIIVNANNTAIITYYHTN